MVFERVEYEAEEPVHSFAGHYQPSATDDAAAAATSTASTAGAPETAPSEPTPAATGAEEAPAEKSVGALAREATSDHPLVPTPSPAVDKDVLVKTE